MSRSQNPTDSTALVRESIDSKILFFGDTHGIFDSLIKVSLKRSPQAVIILGDVVPDISYEITFRELLNVGIDIYFVTGNHDNPRSLFRFFPKERCLDNQIVQIAGLRVAGWGWHGGQDNLFGDSDILVTHEPPVTSRVVLEYERRNPEHSFREDVRRSLKWTDEIARCYRRNKLLGGYSPNGNSYVNGIAERLNVVALYHGHYHDAQWVHQFRSGSYCCVSVSEGGVTTENGRFFVPKDVHRLKENLAQHAGGMVRPEDPVGTDLRNYRRFWRRYLTDTNRLQKIIAQRRSARSEALLS